MEPASPARLYACAAGLALLALGIFGFFHGASFWMNMLFAATGLLGLWLAATAPRAYALGAGVLYTVLGIWGPALALVVGILGLLAAAGTRRRSEARAQAAG